MKIEKPLIIIGAPRSGTTLLFSILSSHPDVWSRYRESEAIFEKYFHPANVGWSRGNELGSEDATPEIVEQLLRAFYRGPLNYQVFFPNAYSRIYVNRLWEKVTQAISETLIFPFIRPDPIRMVEKTPKNSLRIPFLNVVFPDAFFIFLTREPRANISSLIEGWREEGRFETYHVPGGVELEGYEGSMWKFLLPPGWEEYARSARLEEVCAFQYRVANEKAQQALEHLPVSRQMTLKYEDLIARPEEEVRLICDVVGLGYEGGLKRMAEEMPPVNIVDYPDAEKWRRNEAEVMSVVGTVQDIAERLGYIP